MQEQKKREDKLETSMSSESQNIEVYTPRPRKLSGRFFNVLKSKSTSKDYILGNIMVMSCMTILSIMYFSVISQPTNLITAGTIGFIASGAFVGSCIGSFINGLTGKFKDDFDGFSSGLFQAGLLSLSLLPVGIISWASMTTTVLVLLLTSLALPFISIVYSAMGREIRSD